MVYTVCAFPAAVRNGHIWDNDDGDGVREWENVLG